MLDQIMGSLVQSPYRRLQALVAEAVQCVARTRCDYCCRFALADGGAI